MFLVRKTSEVQNLLTRDDAVVMGRR